MLSISQKSAIYVAVKTSYVVSGKTITISKIFTNQVMNPDNYPYIVLYFPDEEDLEQNAVGNYIGTDGSEGQRSLALLSLNIYVKDEQGLSGHDIARDIARQLSIDIRQNWKSLSSGTVKFRKKSKTRNLTSVQLASGITDTARYQFDVFLAYDHVY